MFSKYISSFYYLLLLCILFYILSNIQCKEVDPDTFLRTNELIEKYGYKCETHSVITKDGFNLTVYRIPSNNSGQPVLLQHGFVCDSSNWVLNRNISLAFLLAAQGYDVWINNFRGTNYSMNHVKYNPNEYEFWNWSWDEIAKYDIPAVLIYISEIRNETGNIYYIGHSLGTTVFFALMSSLPEYSQYVKAMFALAPVAYASNTIGFIPFLAQYYDGTKEVRSNLKQGEFLVHNDFLQAFCENQVNRQVLCQNIFFAITGLNVNFNDSTMELILGHYPSSTSMKNAIHYFQQVKYPYQFRFYDYGITENWKYYKSLVPPSYDLTKITVPISFYWGANDWLSVKPDVEYTWSKIPNKTLFFTIPDRRWTHLDFFFQSTAKEMLYDHIINALEQLTDEKANSQILYQPIKLSNFLFFLIELVLDQFWSLFTP